MSVDRSPEHGTGSAPNAGSAAGRRSGTRPQLGSKKLIHGRVCGSVVRTSLVIVLACGLVASTRRTRCDEAVDFESAIQPIFQRHCTRCHGPEKREGGLRLDIGSSALKSGDNYAPVIRPGDSAESALFQFISREDADLQMPPDGPRLSVVEIERIRQWIDQGANWPHSAEGGASPGSTHWAYQPLVRPRIPEVRGPGRIQNAIDHFLVARLEEEGLETAPEADRRTLIRRLYLDLFGLLPSPEDVHSFVQSSGAIDYETLVDRLLASPRFGERWARHWLDVVRFAESHGFEMNQPRPTAWRYRDYVISSINEDKPYDEFVREQLAGDRLGMDAATGFLVGGPWDQVKSPDPVLTAQQRADELHDMVSTTGSAFLALTVGCSRCHAHKFDPISQLDYYAMKACLEGVQHGDRDLPGFDGPESAARRAEAEVLRAELAELESMANPVPVNPRLNVERFAGVSVTRIRFTIRATNSAEPCIDELEVWTVEQGKPSRNVALAANGAKATASSVLPNSEIHRLEHVHDGKYGNSRSWISNEAGAGWVEIELPNPQVVDRILWGRDREEKYADRLATDYVIEVTDGGPWRVVASSADHRESSERAGRRKELQKRIAELLDPPRVYAGRFEQPPPTHRFHRGDPTQVRQAVLPASLGSFGRHFQLPGDSPEYERRLALANWITREDNPLTARVIVNRIWQYHFGEGLVSTPSDFGTKGGTPSHPELLDWLASELVDSGWSMKHVHRLIVRCAAYRRASSMAEFFEHDAGAGGAAAVVADPRSVDSANRLLWRFSPRRIEAEAMRDSILAISGALNLRMGGPGFDLFEPNTNYVKVYTSKTRFGPAEFRRMVYQSKPRMQLENTFGPFDCPDAGQITPKRGSSITPLQALSLLNSPFILQQSELFAARLRREAGPSTSDQVLRAFQLAFQRDPSAEELQAAEELIQAEGLPVFCRALFNAHELIRIE